MKEFYSNLKRRSQLVLKSLYSELDLIEEINKVDKLINSKLKPKNYHGHTGLEVQMIKGFEQTCVLLKQQNVSTEPRKMTTLSFYQALETVKEQTKQRQKR